MSKLHVSILLVITLSGLLSSDTVNYVYIENTSSTVAQKPKHEKPTNLGQLHVTYKMSMIY